MMIHWCCDWLHISQSLGLHQSTNGWLMIDISWQLQTTIDPACFLCCRGTVLLIEKLVKPADIENIPMFMQVSLISQVVCPISKPSTSINKIKVNQPPTAYCNCSKPLPDFNLHWKLRPGLGRILRKATGSLGGKEAPASGSLRNVATKNSLVWASGGNE